MQYTFNPPKPIAKDNVSALYDYIVKLNEYLNVVIPNLDIPGLDELKSRVAELEKVNGSSAE